MDLCDANTERGESDVKLTLVPKTLVNLIKHFAIVIYDSRVVLTRKLPVLQL